MDRLQSLDETDPDGDQGAEARFAVWFGFAEADDGQLVSADDPVLAGLSDELRAALAAITSPT